MSTIESLRRFMRSATFRALCLVSLIGYGIYIGLTVTMEKIIGYHGFTSSFASYVAAVITVGGIVGAAILPGLSEKVGLRKPFLIIAASVPIPMILLIAYISNKPLDLAGAALLGFFLLPALPVTFTIAGEMEDIGPRLAGSAVGTLMAVGLMMLPAVAARHWARGVAGMTYAAVGIAAGCSVLGLLLSYHADRPSGPAIVLAAGAAWVASVLLGPADGLLPRLLRRPHLAG